MKSCVKRFLAPSGLILLVVLSESAKGDILYESSAGLIQTINSSGTISPFVTDQFDPQGLAFSSSGILYVSNFGTNSIEKYSLTGADLGTFASGATLSGPEGMAFDSAGNLYVANQSNNTIEKFSSTGVPSVFVSAASGLLNSPTSLAFDSSGNLYVTNYGSNSIQRFSGAGTSLGTFASGGGLDGPAGLAFDNAGNLYVTNFLSNTIEEFNSSGIGNPFSAALAGLSSPEGLAFDSAGNLYVAYTGSGTIEEFSTTGVGKPFASGFGALNPPDFLAFTTNSGTPLSLPPPSLLDLEYWNGAITAQNGTVNGGSGTWDNATTNWTDSSGTHTLAWAGDMAVFAGTAGTVTLGANISFNTIEFQTTGYVVNADALNSFSLIPSNGANLIADPGVTATVNAPLTGSGSVTKSGTGTLVLGGQSTYTGATTIIGGAIQLGINNALPTGTALTLNATDGESQGLLDLHGFNQTIGSLTIVAPSTAATVVTGAGTLTLGGNVSLVDAAGAPGGNAAVTIAAATLDLGGAVRTFNVAGQKNAADLIVTSAIQDGAVIINAQNSTSAVPNPGTVEFSGADTYSGTTEVQNGILIAGSNSALGTADGTSTTGTTVDAGATLSVSNGVAVGNEALTLNGFGAGTAANSTSPQGGALNVQAGGGTATYNGAITVATNASISANGGTLNLNGGIANNGTTLTFNGNGAGGTVNLGTHGITGSSANSNVVVDGVIVNANANSTYNGTTWITNGGTLNANVLNALPTANGRTAVTMDPTSAISGSSAGSPSKGSSTLNLGANQAIASLTGAASSTVNTNGNVLTIGNTSTNATTFAGVIADGIGSAGTGGLTKDGSSTQIFSGANTYTGATNVNGGTLDLLGSLAGGAVTVNSGGTLAGTGAAGGTVTVNSGGALNPGGLSGEGTLTVGNLVLNAGSTSNFRLTQAGVIGNGVNDLVNVTHDLTIGGNLNISLLGGTGVGSYTLYTYGGNLTGSTFAAITGLNGFNTVISTGVAGEVNLIVTSLGAGTIQYWDGKGAINDNIITGGTGTWSATANNWTTANGSANSTWQGGTAVFGAPGGTVTLGTAISAQALIFGANGYIITGSQALTLTGPAQVSVTSAANTATISAPIAGTAGLTSTGAGTLILASGANTYTGTTSVSMGTLQLGTSSAAAKINAASAVSVNSGGIFSLVNVSGNTFANGVSNGAGGVGTLKINSANINTLSGVLSDGATGQLALTQSGSKTTILTNANNTYSGATTISAGVLQIGTTTAAGSIGSGSAISIGSGGTLLLIKVNNGALANNITNGLSGTGLVNSDSTSSTTFSGVLSNGAGVLALTQSGTGTTTLTGNDTYTGATTVSAGTLQIGNGTSGNLSGTNVTVSGSGSLALDLASGSTFAPNVNLSAAGAALKAIQTSGTTTISGVISGTGVVDQLGSTGTTILTAAETYTGATNVTAGELEVNGSTAATSTVNVAAHGTLAGIGTVKGNVNLTGGGSIDLGSTGIIAGVLNVTGGVWSGLGTVSGKVTSTSGDFNIGDILTASAGVFVTGGTLDGAGKLLGNLSYTSASNSTFAGNISGGSTLTVNHAGATLTLTGANTSTGATTVSAGTLQVGNGLVGILSGTSVVTVSGSGILAVDLANGGSFTDAVVLSAASASFKSLEAGVNSQTISGIISGTGVFNQAGSGTTIIPVGTSDTYTGATNITAGTLQVNGSLASGSTVNVATGGTLTGAGTINGKATLTGNGVISLGSTGAIGGTLAVTGGNWNNLGTVDGVVTSSSGLFNLNGTLTAPAGLSVTGGTLGGAGTLKGKLTYGSPTSSSFGGVIADGSALSTLTMSNAAATFTLTGANTYTGATTVSLGTLQIGNGTSGNLSGTGTVTVNGSGSLAVDLANGKIFSNLVSLNGAGTAFKSLVTAGNTQTISNSIFGTGAFDQNGAGTTIIPVTIIDSYTGPTNVNAGTLDVEGDLGTFSTVNVGTNGTLTGGGLMGGKATLTGNGNISLSNGIIDGTLTVTGGKWSGTGTVEGAVTSTTSAFTLGGTLTAPLGLTVTGGTLTGSGTLKGNLAYKSATSSTFSGVIADGVSPSTVTMSNAAATLTLAGANTYTGATTVSMGTLQIGNGASGNLSGTGTVTVTGSSSLALDLANNGVFSNAVLLNGPSTALKSVITTGNSQTISGVISGTGAFDQSGTGTAVIPLGTADLYTGATNVTAGTLDVEGSLAAGSTVNVGTNGTLDGAGTVHGKATLTGNGTIDLNGGTIGGALAVTGGNWSGTGTVDGAVTSTTGAFNLSGILTAPVGLTVSGGTLVGTGTLDGNLTYSSSASSTFGGVIGGTSVTMNNGSSTLTLTGDNTYAGGTTITAGTLAVGNGTVPGATVGTGPVTVAASGTLSLNLHDGETISNPVTDSGHVVATGSTSNYTVASAISGKGNLTKTGANTVTLTGVNTYTGGTTVSAGTLLVNSSTGTGSVTVANGGTLGGSGTLGGAATLNSGGDIFPSAGTPGTAGTTISGTSLTWNGGGAIKFQIGTTADDITLSGPLTKGSAGAYIIDVINAGISNTATDFTIMTFASSTFSATSFTLELPVNVTGTLVDTGTSLKLIGLHDPPPQSEEATEGGTLVVSQETTTTPALEVGGATITSSVPTSTSQPTILLSSGDSYSQAAAAQLTPTPEPGSTLLLAFGGAALVGWRRRRNAKSR